MDLSDLIKAISEKNNKTNAYDTTAVVRRIEGKTAWVHIPGGVDETPINLTINASPGDTVQVRVSGGKAWIAGNETAPPTDDTEAIVAGTKAEKAQVQAEEASETAESAQAAAESAQESAAIAAGAAASAQVSADNASEYAARALGNLSTVQSVAETLNWITQHGTMTLTTDTELNPAHVYFVVDANGDYTVGGTHYSVVTEPSASELANYYELDIDESLTNYVGTHLAVTGEGLWVLPASTGYKVLIATGNGTTYTEAGTYIIDPNGATVAKFGVTTQIGVTTGTYVDVDSSSVSLKTHIANVLIEAARFTGYALYIARRKIRLLFESNVGTLTVYGNNGTGSRLNLKAVRLDSSGYEASEANINIDIDSSGTAKTSFDSDVYMSENLQVGRDINVMNISALDITNDKTSSVDIEFSGTITDSAGTAISVWPEIEDYLSQDLGTMASDISARLKITNGSVTNLDDADDNGFYTYTSSTTNRPPVNAGGKVLVIKNSGFIHQVAFVNQSSTTAAPRIYVRRTYSSGNWLGWYSLSLTS